MAQHYTQVEALLSVPFLWDIKEARAFLELELGEVPLPFDKRSSITPHSFLGFQEYN